MARSLDCIQGAAPSPRSRRRRGIDAASVFSPVPCAVSAVRAPAFSVRRRDAEDKGIITHKDSAPAAIKAQSSVHVARNAIRVVASSVANNTSSAWLNSKRRAAGTETASNPLDIKCPVIIRRAVRLLPSK